MRCKKCGAQINITDKFCPTCGAKNEYLEGTENLNNDEYFILSFIFYTEYFSSLL